MMMKMMIQYLWTRILHDSQDLKNNSRTTTLMIWSPIPSKPTRDVIMAHFTKGYNLNRFKYFPFNWNLNDPIMSQFSTCQDSTVVMTYAKLWADLITILHISALCVFTRFGLWARKPFVKSVSWLPVPRDKPCWLTEGVVLVFYYAKPNKGDCHLTGMTR